MWDMVRLKQGFNKIWDKEMDRRLYMELNIKSVSTGVVDGFQEAIYQLVQFAFLCFYVLVY